MTHKLKTEMFSQKIEYSGGVFFWPLTPLFSFVSFHLKSLYFAPKVRAVRNVNQDVSQSQATFADKIWFPTVYSPWAGNRTPFVHFDFLNLIHTSRETRDVNFAECWYTVPDFLHHPIRCCVIFARALD